MTSENEERLVMALESLASSFQSIAESQQNCYALAEKRMNFDHPPRKAPTDVYLTRVPTLEDQLREDQGASGETLEEWIGLREQEVIASTKKAGQP